MLQVGRDDEAGARHVDRRHDPEHVRAIVGQAAAGVGEIVRILPERDPWRERGGRRTHGGDLRARGGRPARRLQPVRPRQRVGPKRLPAAGPASLDGDDQTVVRQRVVLGIRQPKAAFLRRGGQPQHLHNPAVGQLCRLFEITTSDFLPPDEVAAVLADVRDRYREPPTDLAIQANRVLIGVRRPDLGIQFHLTGITHELRCPKVPG